MWVELTSDQGDPYYWNSKSRESSWEKPQNESVDWVGVKSQCGSMYFYHIKTMKTSWDPPRRVASAMTDYEKPRGEWQFMTVWKGSNVRDGSEDSCAYPENELFDRSKNRQAVWAEVFPLVGEPYFWDIRNMISKRSLPPHVSLEYNAYQLHDERFFYQKIATGETLWNIPDTPTCYNEWIKVGGAVEVCSLEGSHERFNGLSGVVELLTSDQTAVVSFPEVVGDMVLEVFDKNLRPLSPGVIVRLHGLTSSPDLNDKDGIVLASDTGGNRLRVQIDGHLEKLVSCTRLRPLSRLWYMTLKQEADTIKWRKSEKECIFIDEFRQHRKFFAFLPLSFDEWFQAQAFEDRGRPFPVLFYVHGVCDSPFFQRTKKSNRSKGIEYAASKFVVISLPCLSTWKDRTPPWVVDLIKHIRALSWVDPQRVYVTGSSMGGIAAWEVAAAAANAVAAIALVGASHHQDMTSILIERLCQVPILAVHSESDEKCPLQSQELLWESLEEKGNQWIEVCCAPEISYMDMFTNAYCDSTFLYDWLLRHKRVDNGHM
eukprot:TRINITY_DN50803_c0_g1_i1.p1 TRINITY_DN50803_c0_g1~~TRINITY_DN50803_c0_g1_i1.p1  ORF type:complete len:543 (-),score=60.29 TRINITY_DN50803_c0_g1_i1:366-1994(-)